MVAPGYVHGWEHTFCHEDYEFLRAAAEGSTSRDVASFEDGLAVQRVLYTVARSSERDE